MTRAFYRSYASARTTRLHIMRECGKFPGRQGWCGTQAGTVTRSVAVVLDPMPDEPPAGLTWCPLCVTRAAEKAGVTVGAGVGDLQ